MRDKVGGEQKSGSQHNAQTQQVKIRTAIHRPRKIPPGQLSRLPLPQAATGNRDNAGKWPKNYVFRWPLTQGECSDQSYIDYIDRERQDWQVDVRPAKNKMRALGYAMRYAKHPPISSRRIINFSKGNITISCSRHGDPAKPLNIPLQKFIALLARHVRGYYSHSMRYFGLLAPRNKSRLKAEVFEALGEPIMSKPRRRTFRQLALKTFGKDPVVSSTGASMYLARKQNGAHDKSCD